MEIPLRKYVFPLPGREVVLDVVDDVENLITDLADGDKIPCWAEVWPAARSLGRYIWQEAQMSGRTVLELGCGLGLPGTICALKGALLTFSDYNEQAVKLSLRNAEQNGVSALGHVGDWRSFQLEGKFDRIIGSDVFYDPKLNPYVLEILKKHLAEDGQVLLSHQRRQPTYEFVARVREELKLRERRLNLAEVVEDSVYGRFAVSVHHLYKA